MQTIKITVYELIRDKLGVDEASLTDETGFYRDLGIDSLDFFELMADTENAFHVTIEEDVYEKLGTVGSLVKFIEQKALSMPRRQLAS